MQEKLNIKGSMKATLIKQNGEKEITQFDNMIVDAGYDLVCNSLGAASRPDLLAFIAVGTSTTAAAAGQTALIAELDRNAATYAHTTGTKVFTMTATFAAGDATGAITEAGIFNDASSGSMFDRLVFDVINKGALDSLEIEFTITLS
jgi:hypothetical protein